MRFFALALLAALTTTACGTTGPYVWVESLPPQQHSNDVVINDGDVVNVRVSPQPEVNSVKERVRGDGKITIPMIGDVVARGKRPMQLAAEIQEKLKAMFQAPAVTVGLDAGAEMRISVVGEVKNSGTFQLEPGANVLHALAAAGGLSDYADNTAIFVVRKSLPQRIRFRYADLRSADPKSIQFTLQAGDIVVVE